VRLLMPLQESLGKGLVYLQASQRENASW
jgi:hypothetical protein